MLLFSLPPDFILKKQSQKDQKTIEIAVLRACFSVLSQKLTQLLSL
jgi:hypothetical protein